MSVKQDYIKIAKAGLRGLYLQIVDFYAEAIKTDSEISSYLLKDFEQSEEADLSRSLEKNEATIEAFIDRKINEDEQLASDTEIVSTFENLETTTKYLIEQYAYYGIPVPPEGFLQIDYDVKEWWKFRLKFQNGYFISTQVFKYEDGKLKKNGKEYSFDIKNPSIQGSLLDDLIATTKKDYIEYANQNAFSKIISTDQMENSYFFVLDQGKNSVKYISNPNGKTGKVYIRTFFNEFAQKLNLSLVEIQGVEDLKKVPGGIRKNYVVLNLLKGIKAFEKEAKKKGKPKPQVQVIVDGLNQLKKIIRKSVKKGDIELLSRVGFVFTDDGEYKFLSCLDSENKLINNFELYRFLEDNTELNQYIIRLNAINCRLSGGEAQSLTIPIGNTPSNYQHFVSGNQSYKSETPKERAANYRASRNNLKFVGDAALRIIFDQLRTLAPQAGSLLDTYETFLNRVDLTKMASDFSSLKAKKLTIPQLRKTYFKAYLESLHITELIDCVVENAGTARKVESISFPPSSDGSGEPDLDAEAIVTVSQSSKNFELELKTLLYGKFAFFYNIAKSFEPETFDFPSPEDPLPSVKKLVDDLQAKSNELIPLRENLEKLKAEQEQKENEIKQAENDKNFEVAAVLTDELFQKFDEVNAAAAAVASKEQEFLDAQAALQEDQNKNFMYVLMIPESQIQSIFSTITTNDPQYQYKRQLIDNGMLDARDSAGFAPETFIFTLFKNDIINYSNALSESEFLDFFANIVEQNKRLKKLVDSKEKNLTNSKEDLGKKAKTSQSSLPTNLTFPAFGKRYSSFSLDPLFSQTLRNAFDVGIRKAVEPMVGASKEALDKGFNGDNEALEGLDPDLTSEFLSNNPIQNILDGTTTSYNSPSAIVLQCQRQVFPNNTTQEVSEMFRGFQSDLHVQTQLRLINDTIGPDDIEIVAIKDIFSEAGLEASYASIQRFRTWLRGILLDSGGLNLILQKIEDAKNAAFLNTDLCDDNDADPNDAREAAAAIGEVLSLLNPAWRDAQLPFIFSCNPVPGKDAAFPDIYSDAHKDSLDKTVEGRIESINSFFNDDISKFKPTILEQNLTPEGIFINLFGSDKDKQGERVFKILQDVEKTVQANNPSVVPEGINTDEYETEQKDLKTILQKAFYNNPVFSDLDITALNDDAINKYVFSSNGVQYNIIITKQDTTFSGLDLQKNKFYIIVTSDDEIIYLDESESQDLDFTQMYEKFITSFNPLEFGIDSTRNELFQIDYPFVPAELEKISALKFFSQELLGFLRGEDSSGNANFSNATGLLLKTTIDSLFSQFLETAVIFDNTNFNNIPLKDAEALELGQGVESYNKNYLDGGVLITDEIFEIYKNLRRTYQCFVLPGSSPDAHQVANLKSIYQLLFNTLITEGLMQQFFIIGQNQLSFAADGLIKTSVIGGIPKAFKKSLTRIEDLQLDYRSDIDILYKFKVLEEKSRARQDNITDYLPDGTPDPNGQSPEEWNLETTEDKIQYLAEEYYPKIIDRIQNRIKASIPTFGTTGFQVSDFTSYNKPPGDGIAFNMYDDISYDNNATIPIPVLTGLKKGIILQKYVDVRQNGAILDELKLGKISGGAAAGLSIASKTEPIFVGSDKAYKIKVNSRLYLPLVTPLAGSDNLTVTSEYYNKNFNETLGTIYTPAYCNIFFTKHATPDTDVVVAAPNIQTFQSSYNDNGVLTTYHFMNDVDSAVGYNKAIDSNYLNFIWSAEYYRSQGCISFDDFKLNYKKFLSPGIGAPYFLSNGPSTYFKKLRVGIRACLVLSPDDFDKIQGDFNEAKEKYFDIVETIGESQLGSGNFLRSRELLKEKFGLYKNENGDEFIVIPIIKKENDLLPAIQNTWENNSGNLWFERVYNDTVGQMPFAEATLGSSITNSLSAFSPSSLLKDVLPIFVSELIKQAYGDKISDMFNPTKEEILRIIKQSKAFINGEWDFDPRDMMGSFTDSENNQKLGAGNAADQMMAMYIPLILSLVPLLIQFLATFLDPTWKTPWFHPGPTQVIGYIAKILSATNDIT